MLSIFTHCKAFNGHIGVIQRNAIRSWARLDPACEIFLFGDREGTAEAASEFGVHHVPESARNEFGTPLLSDVFAKGESLATRDIHMFINCDIVLGRDFIAAVRQIADWRKRFLIVGQCWDMNITEPIAFDRDWERERDDALAKRPIMRGEWAIDYFVFPRGLYGKLPPFTLGRAKFDNWLVWKAAADLKVPVVNATRMVRAIHQNHDYAHVPGGKEYAYYGVEAVRNEEYAGGPEHCYAICHATHRLMPTGIKRSWRRHRLAVEKKIVPVLERAKTALHPFRWRTQLIMRHRVTPAFWRAMERTQSARHALGLSGKNLSRILSIHRKDP